MMEMVNKYGLIGFPLGHSFSKKYFSEKFKKEGIKASYDLYPLESISELEQLLREESLLKGLNVTIPYKEAVLPYLSSISEEAKKIGAVNTIKIKISDSANEKFLEGYNTDFIGFRDSLQPLLNEEIKNALILGTGGASKAVKFALESLGINTTYVSRHPKDGQLTYQELTSDIIDSNLLIVNTTPLGMSPNIDSCPEIPYHLLSSSHISYDLVYNPEITEFMKRSAQYGAKVKNGLEMLYMQAEAAWKIWNV